MDEKRMVSLNALSNINLGAKLAAQVEKRKDAPPPTEEKRQEHIATLTAAPTASINTLTAASASTLDNNTFFQLWETYYPTLVSVLGMIPTWILPPGVGKVLTIIKGMLAVVNNNVIPIVKLALTADILEMLQALARDTDLMEKVKEFVAAHQRK